MKHQAKDITIDGSWKFTTTMPVVGLDMARAERIERPEHEEDVDGLGKRGPLLHAARQFGPARLDVWEGDARKLQFSGRVSF